MSESKSSAASACAAIEESIGLLGANFDPSVLAATRAIYKPHLDLTPVSNETHNVAYGDHPRHRLDVYRDAARCEAIAVFVHGGGFIAGDKNGDGAFYPNVGRWLARQGIMAVLPNYRLAPDHPWPAGAQDVEAVVTWVRSEPKDRQGHAPPIFVIGQSAGATHVAGWLFDDAARGRPRSKVDGVMLMSGFYAPEAPLPAGPKAYFGDDPVAYAPRSPITHVGPVGVPLWLSVCEYDPGWMAQHTYAMARAVTLTAGRSPDFRFFRGHNHVSTVHSLGSPQQDVGKEIVRFIRKHSRP